MRTELCLVSRLPGCGRITTTCLPAAPNPEDSGSQGAKGGTALCEWEGPEQWQKASELWGALSAPGTQQCRQRWSGVCGEAAGLPVPPSCQPPLYQQLPAGPQELQRQVLPQARTPPLAPWRGVSRKESELPGSERTTRQGLPSPFLAYDPRWPRSPGVPGSPPSPCLRQCSACHREEAGPLSTCGCVPSARHNWREDPQQQRSRPRKPLLP